MEATKKNKPKSAEDFFATDINKDMEDFLEHMKRPKEEIDLPTDIDNDLPPLGESNEETALSDELSQEEERQLSEHLKYTDEQAWSAEFILTQMDKIFAFGFSLLTREQPSRYRARTAKAKSDDHEVVLLAAIINKYQLKFSLEFAFMTAILMKYGMVYQAVVMPDIRAQKKKAKNAGERRTDNHNHREKRNG